MSTETNAVFVAVGGSGGIGSTVARQSRARRKQWWRAMGASKREYDQDNRG